jgi:hypothetical protein
MIRDSCTQISEMENLDLCIFNTIAKVCKGSLWNLVWNLTSNNTSSATNSVLYRTRDCVSEKIKELNNE